MVFDTLNDLAGSRPFMALNGLILLLVGLRHLFMPSGSLVDLLFEPVFQDQARMTVARIVGLVVATGGLGTVGNALEDYGVY